MAIPVAVVAPIAVMYGRNYLPSREAAVKAEKLLPWVFTWGLVWITVIAALAIAASILVAGGRRDQRAS